MCVQRRSVHEGRSVDEVRVSRVDPWCAHLSAQVCGNAASLAASAPDFVRASP